MTNMLLTLHVAGGSAALLSMVVPLLSRKGGPTHRLTGWVFVAGMATVAVTALLMAAIRFVTHPFPGARTSAIFLGYLAMLTGAGVSTGVRVLRAKGRTAAHRDRWDLGVSTLLTAVAILVAAYGIAIGHALLIAFALVGFLSGSGQLAYWLRSPSHPMHWWFEHMGQMLGSCIAAITAFVVNNGARVGLSNSSVLVWLAPTLIGVPIIVIWIGCYVRRFAASPFPPHATATGSSLVKSATGAAAGATLVLALAATSHAQVARADPTLKRFDVASVRPDTSDVRQDIQVTPDGVRLTHWALRPIIQLAFGVDQPSRLAGVPSWAETERFDVIGKAATGSRDDLRPMLRTLLEERFQLRAHTEQRRIDVYRLVLLHPERGPLPSLHASTAECLNAGDAGQPRPPANAVRCGPQPGGPGRLVLVGSPVGVLGSILALMVGRPVIDETGLTGRFDVEITHASDAQRAAGVDGPSIFTALQEQLGLKLQPTTQAQDVLVIDHVEHPDPD